MSGPVTRSRSRANSSFRRSEGQTNVGMAEQTELISKLSELLNAIEKSTRTNQQSHEQLAERTEKGIRTQTDFLTLQEQQRTQLATLITQNSLQVAPVLHPAPFLGKPTDDITAFLSHFERYSKFCEWDSKQCLRALPLYLQGNASSWYTSLDTCFENYDDLVNALKDHFSNPASMWLLRQQLSARKQQETESLANYAADIRRLCKRLGLSDSEGMHYFIQGLHADLKSHVILGQPKTLAEAENLAHLKEAVSISTPRLAQYKLESQLQSVIKSLETLTSNAHQNEAPNLAAYDHHPKSTILHFGHEAHNNSHTQYYRQQPSPSRLRHDSGHIEKLVREEVRRQTQFLTTPTSRSSNSGVPSIRNRRTTDGLPICNKCDKVGHIARNCRAGSMQRQPIQTPPYPLHVRPNAPHQYNPHVRPVHNSHIRPDAPTFNPHHKHTGNNPFHPGSGN